MSSITPEQVQAFNACDRVMKLKTGKPKAEPSFLKTRRVLRLALVWAEQAGLIAKSPITPKGESVAVGPLLVRLPPVIPESKGKSSGRRTVLANWIASKDNPLTARVIVNRVWQYHFGRGIVATASDFGKLGGTPSNPELLDWLASEFVARPTGRTSLRREARSDV